MIIVRRKTEHGSLLPAAHDTIAALPDSLLYHNDHGIRHPASAYTTSLRLIALQWIKFLDCLDKLRSEYQWEGKTTSSTAATEQYAQLLHRLNEHHDATYAVIRAVCPPTRAKPNRMDAQYLDQAKLPGWKTFRDATRGYREDHIGLIVNHLKHRQGELRSVSFQSTIEFRPGYFLLDILQDGLIGPNRKLHSGGNTAFSFARDQLLHLWWLYRVGELLSNTLTTAAKQLHGLDITVSAKDAGGLPWDDLLARLSSVKPEYFTDELSKPQPLAILSAQPASFTIQFPSAARGIPLNPIGLTAQTELTVDGAYPTIKVPYLGHMP